MKSSFVKRAFLLVVTIKNKLYKYTNLALYKGIMVINKKIEKLI